MSHLRPILTVVILLVILAVAVTLFGRSAEAPGVDVPATTTPAGDVPGSGTTAPPAIGNRNITFAFEATMPTPCHRLSPPDVRIAESFPEQVTVSYGILPPAEGVMCAQVITDVEVTDTVQAPESAILSSVIVGGTPVEFAIVR